MAVPVPLGLNAIDCAAIGCNLVDLYRSIAPYPSSLAEPSVLIVSGDAGNMALYGVVLARALGLPRIDFLDDDRERLAAAETLGARPIVLSDTAPRIKDLYPIVVDCSGIPRRLALALSLVSPDGVCTGVWPHTGACSLPVGAMFMRNATFVTGQPHARAHMGTVLRIMQERKLSSTSIPVEVLPWDSANEAFGTGAVKRIFTRP
jgi:threonine dehydrogenase-like Zn-dependent dehydrogenase